jgi:hypothetical protein
MNSHSHFGLAAAMIAATLLVTYGQTALAKRAPTVRKQQPIFYPSDDIRCVERSFSISVGNPAYKSRLSIWPAPCGR